MAKTNSLTELHERALQVLKVCFGVGHDGPAPLISVGVTKHVKAATCCDAYLEDRPTESVNVRFK